jgi:hypothetical protein
MQSELAERDDEVAERGGLEISPCRKKITLDYQGNIGCKYQPWN